jgi:hypothetical protein
MAGLEYEGELVTDEMLTGAAFVPAGTAGVATFGRNYRQRDGKRSAATGKFFTDDFGDRDNSNPGSTDTGEVTENQTFQAVTGCPPGSTSDWRPFRTPLGRSVPLNYAFLLLYVPHGAPTERLRHCYFMPYWSSTRSSNS